MALLPWRRGRPGPVEHPLARFRGEMERVFDEFFRGWLPGPWSAEYGPALDVRQTESEVIVDLEVPGLKPEELDISVSENVLTIRGEKKAERDEKKGDYHLCERTWGSFSRTVQLPASVNADKATATHKDGVVTIVLPKTEKSKAKKIEVK